MERNISIMGHLPEFYSGVLEFENIAKAENAEFESFKEFNRQDLLDAFVLSASERSISIWEKEIGIRSDATGESLDFRRKRLINRYTTKPPFTIKWLDAQLEAFLGAGFIKTERDDDVEILYVYIDIDSLAMLREFDATIETVLPLSMQYYKNIIGKRELPCNAYAGSTNPMHLHIEINPA